MILRLVHFMILGIAMIPLIYYSIVLYSSWRFFRRSRKILHSGFLPPVSNLKPIRGIDPEAYENFASFCRQDYPEYEVIFCVGDASDPALPNIQRLIRDFPKCQIRVLIGSGRVAANDKVAKLARMTAEAKYETVVMSDSDVRVRPDYLRTMVARLEDPKVGAVTCFYVPIEAEEKTFVQRLQAMGMLSDFYAGILVAWQLDGIKFALGPSIASTKKHLASFGGYAAIENRPADDLLVGRLIAEQGYEVELLRYSVLTVADFQSLRDLLLKRLRWIVVMRNMRSVGTFGPDLHSRPAMGSGGHCRAADLAHCRCLPGCVFGVSRGDHGDHWKLGPQATGRVQEVVDDSCLGLSGGLYLAGQLHAQQDSLARWLLPHCRGRVGAP